MPQSSCSCKSRPRYRLAVGRPPSLPWYPQDPQQSAKAAVELARWRREADAYAIVCAVADFTEELRRPDHMLDSVDMLRLRAMLMVIGVAAQPPGASHASQL